MAKGAYYNDNSREACATLRVLIAEGHIAPGDVDERSIKDVRADDLRGYAQVHMFAGVGIWSGALRAAGWEDDRPAWSGSCPCQPFSQAGKGLGFDDPRHLWPDWFRLIGECRPDTIFGEQVASAGLWIGLVSTDLESAGYAFGSPDLCAAGFAQGAHIRQRLDWVADRHNAERWSDLAGRHFGDWPQAGRIEGYSDLGAGWTAGGVGHAPLSGIGSLIGKPGQSAQSQGAHRGSSLFSGMADGAGAGQRQESAYTGRLASGDRTQGFAAGPDHGSATGGMGDHHHHQGLAFGSLTPDSRGAIRVEGPAFGEASSLCGCDWLLCTDGRVRPVEAGTFPLDSTHPGRLGALRLYGNGLDFTQTVNFISAYMEAAEIMELVT